MPARFRRPALELPIARGRGLETAAGASSSANKECRLMQMLYNSDHYVVVEFDMGVGAAESGDGKGAYEIVDKFARRGIFLNGAVADGFKAGVDALVERGPTEEEVDDFIAGYTLLAQQPVILH
jgi:hypothetical protein